MLVSEATPGMGIGEEVAEVIRIQRGVEDEVPCATFVETAHSAKS
jgi:hypothetical protein